jgi:hypothetical protein
MNTINYERRKNMFDYTKDWLEKLLAEIERKKKDENNRSITKNKKGSSNNDKINLKRY